MTNLEILNKKLENTNSKYDDLLNQFNLDVAQIGSDRAKIVEQIDTETKRILNTDMIGRCYTYRQIASYNYIYMKIYDAQIIENNELISIKGIVVKHNMLSTINTDFYPESYTEIPVTEFDVYLSKTLSNLVQLGTLNKHDILYSL